MQASSSLTGHIVVGGPVKLGHDEFRVAGQLPPGHQAHLSPAAFPGIMAVFKDLHSHIEIAGKFGVIEGEVISACPDIPPRGAGIANDSTVKIGLAAIAAARVAAARIDRFIARHQGDRPAAQVVTHKGAIHLVEIIIEGRIDDRLDLRPIFIFFRIGKPDKDGFRHRVARISWPTDPGSIVVGIIRNFRRPPGLENVAPAGQARRHRPRPGTSRQDCLIHIPFTAGLSVNSTAGRPRLVFVTGAVKLGHDEFRVAGQLPPGHQAHLPPAANAVFMRILDESNGYIEIPRKLGVVEAEVIAACPDITTPRGDIGDVAPVEIRHQVISLIKIIVAAGVPSFTRPIAGQQGFRPAAGIVADNLTIDVVEIISEGIVAERLSRKSIGVVF